MDTFKDAKVHLRRLVEELHKNLFYLNGGAAITSDEANIRLTYILDNGDTECIDFAFDDDGYMAAEAQAKEKARSWKLETEEFFESLIEEIEFRGFIVAPDDFCFKLKRRKGEEPKFPYSITGYAQCRNWLDTV